MERLTDEQRQLSGCGYLPQPDERVRAYVNLSAPLGCKAEVTMCPGYSTGLPEVIEASRGRLHWSKGNLREFTAGQPTESLMIAIEIIEGASNEMQSWCIKNPEKK
jgi:hypothetical protein